LKSKASSKVSVEMTKNIHQVTTELIPAIKVIFELGFIPKEEEIVEFDEATYRLAQSHGEEFERPLYQILSRELHDSQIPKNVLQADEVGKLKQGIHFFADYAQEHHLLDEDDETILKHAAQNLPRMLAMGTEFERPLLKIAERYEKIQTPQEEMINFLEKAAGENEIIQFNLEDEQGVKREEIIAPTAEKGRHELEGKRMSYKAFKQFAFEQLSDIFKGDEYTVEEEISRRTDEDAYEVIRVWDEVAKVRKGKGLRVSTFYQDYALGKSLEDIILSMVDDIKEDEGLAGQLEIPDVLNFERSKDKIIVRPLNFKKNEQLLKDYLYQRHGDIALVIYMIAANSELGLATAKVGKEAIEEWGITEALAFDWAITNTQNLFEPYVVPAESLQAEILPEDYPDKHKYFMRPDCIIEKSRAGSYHFFLDGNINAATAVFYPDVLKRFSALVDDDLYIVIASMSFIGVHERKSISLSTLRKMAIKEKTNPYADPAEFLSDGVYHYSRRDDRLALMYHKI